LGLRVRLFFWCLQWRGGGCYVIWPGRTWVYKGTVISPGRRDGRRVRLKKAVSECWLELLGKIRGTRHLFGLQYKQCFVLTLFENRFTTTRSVDATFSKHAMQLCKHVLFSKGRALTC
jgi:hypothetical protein